MSSIDAGKRRIKWRGFFAIVVSIAVVLIGVIAAVSQKDPGEQPERKVVEVKRLTEPAKKAPTRIVTRSAGGKPVVRDDSTGQTRDLTPEEQRRLAAGLAELINKSTDGLIQTTYDDGTVMLDLADHFHSVMMAKVGTDGSVTIACADELDAAAAFFRIDPVIVEAAKQKAAELHRDRVHTIN